MAVSPAEMACPFCSLELVLFDDENAYVRRDDTPMSQGHVMVMPRRHVADFFDMTWEEKTSWPCSTGLRQR